MAEMIPPAEEMVLGIDGGGSHVVALLADAKNGRHLGRGEAGPANLQAVGVENALRELNLAVQRAFADAGIPRTSVTAACLGLAGIDWDNGLDVIHAWAERVHLASQVSVANDATLLLAAGTPAGWGLAVVGGTGSIAFVRTPDGQEGRAGGWGYLLGDGGSAYHITLSALRLVCHSVDGCVGPTCLVDRFLQAMQVSSPAAIIDAVYRGPWDRAALAALAPLVVQAAEEGDSIARQAVEQQAAELALVAATALRKHRLPLSAPPIALTGGLLLHSAYYRQLFLNALFQQGVNVDSSQVQLVHEPALGAIALARKAIHLR